MLSWSQQLRALCFFQENGLTEGPNGERVMGNGALVCDPLLDTKRWHSLEDMPLQNENSKKIITRSSLRAWLFGLFNNSGYRNSDASLRKANCNYMDLQADKESIVWLRLRNRFIICWHLGVFSKLLGYLRNRVEQQLWVIKCQGWSTQKAEKDRQQPF